MELTKEYFDEQIKSLNKRLDNVPPNDAISVMQADISTIQTNITGIQTDISGLQDDMRSVKTTLNEMNQTLTALDKRDIEDSDAFAKTLVRHDNRITKLELKFKQV